MAAPAGRRRALSVCRSIIRELQLAFPKGSKNIRESAAYSYVLDQYRDFQVTDKKICRGEKEMQHLAETYLCYLRSTRQHKELHDEFHGKGERSIEQSANLVGLRMPNLYKDPEST